MKKLLQMKFMLLLCALIVGSGTMWADDTYTQVTDVDNLDTDATYIIADVSGTPSAAYAMGTLNSSSRGSIVTSGLSVISSSIVVSSEATTKPLEFTLTKSGDYYTISYGSTATYLGYNSGTAFTTATTLPSDNNLKKYQWDIKYNDTYKCLLINNVNTTTRYIIRNGTSAISAYSNTNLSSYGKSTLYKKEDSTAPSISANNPSKLAYNATSGEISYTINNAVTGASVLASTTADWISNFSYATAGKVTYTIAKNTTQEDRSGKVTLTYANGGTTLATKDVTVTQGHLDVSAPDFNPGAGTYDAAQNVTLEGPANSTIYYTTDGTDPTTSSSTYSSAISVNVSQTIKAIAVVDGVSSSVAEAEYVLKLPITVTPDGATFEESQEVTLSSVAGATIKYTLDNSDPSGEGAITYSAPFTLTATKTVKAIATKSGWTNSDVATATFTKIDPNDVWVKTGLSALTSDDVFVIVGAKTVNNTTTTHAMSNDKGASDGPDAVEVTISNNMISSTVDNKIKWNVSRTNDGFTFYPNGTTTTWLYCTGSNDGVRIGTSDDKYFTISTEGYLYNTGKSCYVGIYNNSDWRRYGTINTNIQNQTFATYKHGISVTLAAACTDGEKYYGTFCSSVPFKVPADVTVSEIGIDSEGKLIVEDYAEGAVVPANTGVMISATTAGKKTFTPASGGTSVLGNDNCLRPSGYAISDLTANDMGTKDPNCLYYRLTMHGGTKLGFWWGAENGGTFGVAANKAYMVVPDSSDAREGFAFDDDSTTGISNVNVNENVNGSVFDLQGRKVSTPGKGLYIVNGKKVVIK